jgi:PEP-CTERM motif
MTSSKSLWKSIFRSTALALILAVVAIGSGAGMASAITITPAQPGADVSYDAAEQYLIGGKTGITRLKGLSVTLAPRGGSAGFVNTLGAAFGAGWNFMSAASDLTGAFNIDVYDAVGTAARVGVDFDMNYVTGVNDLIDFTDANRAYHWIQRVVNNHALAGGHGVNADRIDTSTFTPPADVVVPYYDVFSAAEILAGTTFPTAPPRFQDGPGRLDADKDHVWMAELYLVEELAMVGGVRQVRIYNGVNWGWSNEVPEPASMLIFATGLGALALGRRRRRRATRGACHL